MNVADDLLVAVAVVTFIGAAIAFSRVAMKESDDVVLQLSDAGAIWIFLRQARDGWRQSAFGRCLTVIAVCSASAAGLLYVFSA